MTPRPFSTDTVIPSDRAPSLSVSHLPAYQLPLSVGSQILLRTVWYGQRERGLQRLRRLTQPGP